MQHNTINAHDPLIAQHTLVLIRKYATTRLKSRGEDSSGGTEQSTRRTDRMGRASISRGRKVRQQNQDVSLWQRKVKGARKVAYGSCISHIDEKRRKHYCTHHSSQTFAHTKPFLPTLNTLITLNHFSPPPSSLLPLL